MMCGCVPNVTVPFWDQKKGLGKEGRESSGCKFSSQGLFVVMDVKR